MENDQRVSRKTMTKDMLINLEEYFKAYGFESKDAKGLNSLLQAIFKDMTAQVEAIEERRRSFLNELSEELLSIINNFPVQGVSTPRSTWWINEDGNLVFRPHWFLASARGLIEIIEEEKN